MNRDRIVTGIILIGIGIMFLLANMGLVSWWSFSALFDFWPLILVVVGINIMFKKNTIVSVISWVLFFGVLIGFSFYNFNGDMASGRPGTHNMTIANQTETTEGDVKLVLGGVKMNMSSTENHLFDASYSSREIRTEERHNDNKVIIKVEPKEKNKFIKTNSDSEYFNAKLNKDVVWDIDASIGAVSGELDFGDLSIRNLDLDIGAGNIDLFMGDQYIQSNVEINTGASKLKLYIKEGVGVKIKLAGILSKTNLSDLGWVKEGDYYYSNNYQEAKSQINFDINVGVGKFDIIVR
ncbi:LiaF transmembrane domain-containing protein [Alkaliphilus hydrothermalis]|uniref:LiaI-LiaF-like transmembrane region domain-containing protein n=1 Tax=Alkaliphilus hydrothermalis TaxID=1482730 RepID=A0ABS2NL01_9FIRM|nr:DUF5668 domain-containing protein [Alkaliphilus hydrothermalis]MBM7613502.1 hypothetical protein [Alkaliphilus hydrothermalis]